MRLDFYFYFGTGWQISISSPGNITFTRSESIGFPFVPSIQALSVKLSVVPFPIGTNITNEKESSGGFASEVYPVNTISPAAKVVGVTNNF